MAQYLMSIWHDEEYTVDFSSPEMQQRVAEVTALNEELQNTGVWVFGAGLLPASSATVIKSDSGTISMTDGPYAESKEQMGGFYVIDVDGLDEALEWAARMPNITYGSVEVRPVLDFAMGEG